MFSVVPVGSILGRFIGLEIVRGTIEFFVSTLGSGGIIQELVLANTVDIIPECSFESRRECASSERKVFDRGTLPSSLVVISNNFVKSSLTFYNFQVLTVKRVLVYAIDIPANCSLLMKGNKELGANRS